MVMMNSTAQITGSVTGNRKLTKEEMEKQLRRKANTSRRKFNKFLMGSAATAPIRVGL